MNKKQRNRKLVTQNKRNRIINRRYSSTIKSLSKLFKSKINTIVQEKNIAEQKKLIAESDILQNSLYSIIDKAVKKNVIHKNNAARKKSKLFSLRKKNVQY
jgi:small subunit ribosomal protein S20